MKASSKSRATTSAPPTAPATAASNWPGGGITAASITSASARGPPAPSPATHTEPISPQRAIRNDSTGLCMPFPSPGTGAGPSEDELGQVLLLHDLLQPAADVRPVDHHALARQVRALEAHVLDHALQDGVQPAGAD